MSASATQGGHNKARFCCVIQSMTRKQIECQYLLYNISLMCPISLFSIENIISFTIVIIIHQQHISRLNFAIYMLVQKNWTTDHCESKTTTTSTSV